MTNTALEKKISFKNTSSIKRNSSPLQFFHDGKKFYLCKHCNCLIQFGEMFEKSCVVVENLVGQLHHTKLFFPLLTQIVEIWYDKCSI